MFFVGGQNYAGIFQWSELGRKLEAGTIDLPISKVLPNSNIELPVFFLGDSGFPLKKYLMKPYFKGSNYGAKEKIFNYRLSRARRIIECSLGTMKRKWKILDGPLLSNLETVECVVLAVLTLHNFLITREGAKYLEVELENSPENEDDPEDQLIQVGTANNIRNSLAQYFLTDEGSVEWQNKYARI